MKNIDNNVALTSTKPYLIRALYDWIVDNHCTPYVVVNAEARDVEVPRQYIEDGRIVLNIDNEAVHELKLNNNFIEFNARFNGVATQVYVPINAVLAIYAHENGHGMVFNEEHQNAPAAEDGSSRHVSVKRPDPNKKVELRVIK